MPSNEVIISQRGQGLSSLVAGAVTNPGAGGTIVSLTVPSPGAYMVQVNVWIGGTVTAADANNMNLQSDPATSGTLVNQGTLGVVPVAGVPIRETAVVEALSTIVVKAVAAASGVSAVYYASIVATPIDS